mgnify:CR=1 FL=1
MKKITFTRKELYDLVWSTPISKLSKEYGISFHKLRTTCDKMDIPVPDYGHWMRIQHNKPIEIKELPTDFKGNLEVTFEINDENNESKGEVISERNRLIKEIKSNHHLPIKVSSRLRNPDKLIIAAMNDLTPDKHPYGNYNGLMSTSGGVIDITVAPKNIQRALRFMDSLIKLLKTKGHDVRITNNGTCAIVFDEEITICLQEKLRIEESIDNYGWRSRKYFPSDILTFRMWIDFRFRQKVWGTGKYTIEELLPEILATLELLAQKEIQERIEREKRWKEQEERERIEKEIRERIENEYKQFKKLFRQANLLHKANTLREYVKTVEAHAMQNGEMTEDLINWIIWAKNKIDWFDPLITKKDPVLDDDFRKILYREVKEGRI